jgi:hypothetical protein
VLPKDIAGIFSRFFISGFFVPAFTALFTLWLSTSDALRPDSFRDESGQTQVFVLGGLALLIALVLQGMRFRLIQIYEGYGIRDRLIFRPLRLIAIRLQRWSYDRVKRSGQGEDWKEQWLLDRRFPLETDRLLPTRLGNAFRAYEDYADSRWGLDMVAIWPRVDSLLGPREQELHWNAYTDLMLFINLSLASYAVGVVLIANELVDSQLSGWARFLYVLPFLVGYILYRFAIGAAERLGAERRASVDLHRLELYHVLGLKKPLTADEEREKIAPAVNELLLYGRPIPDEVVMSEDQESKGSDQQSKGSGGKADEVSGRTEKRIHLEDSPGEPRRPPKPKPKEPKG